MKIMDCSDNILYIKLIINSGVNSLKNIGPKHSMGKNGKSYLFG